MQKLVNTQYFCEAARHKKKHGVYCGAPMGSREYVQYWKEQKHRMLYGYSVAGVRVTGYHYTFLNFKQLEVVKNVKAVASRKNPEDFPRFWYEHYRFFHAFEEAKGNYDITEHLPEWQKVHEGGKHIVILKPRGTGFSQVMSSIGVTDYTLRANSKSFYYASNEGYLNKDGIINKCWDHLNFMDTQTEGFFKQLRQIKNKDLHKRASRDVNGAEIGLKSEIIARVIDHPRKVRGARGATIFFEEGGSFPNLKGCVRAAIPLVEQGGVVTGTIIVWGTGGEEGPGIEGLDDMFNRPAAFKMMEFDDEWTPGLTKKCGYFFPVQACMDKFMDEFGNPLLDEAIEFEEKNRERIKREGTNAKDLDQHIAEYPFTPQEALMRLKFNKFPVNELTLQRNRILSSPELQKFGLNGLMGYNEKGDIDFILSPNVTEVADYPHDDKGDLAGCITIYEKPLKYGGKVDPHMYIAVNDSYYKDEAEYSRSLGATYIIKRPNHISTTEDDIIVAKYVGRPRFKDTYFRQMFLLVQYYNTTLQAEIAGGGEMIKDYATRKKLLHLCEKEPDIIFNKEKLSANRGYFMKMDKDRKEIGIEYLANWLEKERSITENGTILMNLNKIYDLGLLNELIKYNDTGNFDRVSAMIVAMFQLKEMHALEVGSRTKRKPSNYMRSDTYDYLNNNSKPKRAKNFMLMRDDTI